MSADPTPTTLTPALEKLRFDLHQKTTQAINEYIEAAAAQEQDPVMVTVVAMGVAADALGEFIAAFPLDQRQAALNNTIGRVVAAIVVAEGRKQGV